MTHRVASCSCARVTVTCEGEPVLVSLCSCLACQKRTGTPFGIAAFWEQPMAVAAGPTEAFVRRSESGYDVTHHFCPACGSTVFWFPARMPDLIAVAAGAFADPGFPAPEKAVHSETAHPWLLPALRDLGKT